jgi:hypothetical protein
MALLSLNMRNSARRSSARIIVWQLSAMELDRSQWVLQLNDQLLREEELL